MTWRPLSVSVLCYFLALQGVGSSQSLRLEDLIRELGAPATSDRAADDLLRLGRSDPAARKYLAQRLPAIIARGPISHEAWTNSTRVAGGLRMAEASAALAKWIDVDVGGTITFSQELRLENKPAANALAQIGEPALPAVAGVLENGGLGARWTAAYVLNSIGSSAAKKALGRHLPREHNPHIRDFILSALEKPAANDPTPNRDGLHD